MVLMMISEFLPRELLTSKTEGSLVIKNNIVLVTLFQSLFDKINDYYCSSLVASKRIRLFGPCKRRI